MASDPIRVVVVDDEKWARRRLEQLLARHPGVEVVATASSGESAVRAVAQETPDVLFLDVQMPEMDGFDVVRQLQSSALPMPAVIFVTAHDEYAVRAFEANALDYLTKPFENARFEVALDRALRHLERERIVEHHERLSAAVGATPPGALSAERLCVKEGTHYVVIDPDTLVWAEAQDVYVVLHTDDGDRLVRERLYQIHERLDTEQFVRAHRSAVVNGRRVTRLVPGRQGRATLVMDNGDEVPVSRSCRPNVNAFLDRLGDQSRST